MTPPSSGERRGSFLVSLFLRLIDARPGEGPLILGLFLYQFTIIFSYSIIKPVRSSLLIDNLGADKQPLVYLLTALIVGFVVTGYQWFVQRLERHQLVPAVILFFTTNLLLFWWFLPRQVGKTGGWSDWISAILFIWGDIFSVTVVTLGWGYAADLLTPDQGKRLFGPISTGSTLGGILGSEFTGRVAVRIGTENLLLVSACLLAPAALVAVAIHRSGLGSPVGGRKTKREKASALEGVSLIRDSSYLLSIVGILGLMLLASLLIEYQFSKAVELAIHAKDEKTAFIAGTLKWSSMIGFLTQSLVLGRLVKALGIGIALIIHPLATILTSSGYLVMPTLGMVWYVKMLDWTLKYGINQSTREMLYLPTTRDAKYKAKAFIDIFFYRLVKAVVAVVVLGGVYLGMRPHHFSAVIIGVSMGWILVARRIATSYRPEVARRIVELVPEPAEGGAGRPGPDRAKILDGLARCYAEFSAAAGPGSGERALPLDLVPGMVGRAVEAIGAFREDRTILRCVPLLLAGAGPERALAQEYLDVTLPAAERRFVMPLVSTGVTPSEALALAREIENTLTDEGGTP